MDALTVACVSGGANLVLGVVAYLIKRALDANDTRTKALEEKCTEHQKELHLIREMMPTAYVRRDDFKALGDAIFGSLRRIEDKLDNKVDKP